MNSFPHKRTITKVCLLAAFYVVLRDVPEDVAVALIAATGTTLLIWVGNVVMQRGLLNLCEAVLLAGEFKIVQIRESRQLQQEANDVLRRELRRREMYVAN